MPMKSSRIRTLRINYIRYGRVNLEVKLKKIEISGFRGVRNQLTIPLQSSSSLLLYGENGGGKSSIADGLEWFYYDRVGHLSVAEIGTRGIPALRNMNLNQKESAYVALEFTNPDLSAKKSLSIENSRNVAAYSNSTSEFENYLNSSNTENLILRYRDLLEFITLTKMKKLEGISRIIGFGEVEKKRKILRTAVSKLNTIAKNRDYDNQISRRQAEIIQNLGQNITTEAQFIDAIANLLNPLDLGVKVTDDASLREAIEKLESGGDYEAILLSVSYTNAHNAIENIVEILETCRCLYDDYYTKLKQLGEDSDKLSGLGVLHLLTEGVLVLEGIWEQESCPMCLRPTNRIDLLTELKSRQGDLSNLSRETEEIEKAKASVVTQLQELVRKIDSVALEQCISLDENKKIKSVVKVVSKLLAETLKKVSDLSIIHSEEFIPPDDLFDLIGINLPAILDKINEKKNAMGEKSQLDERFKIARKVAVAMNAYQEVENLRAEQSILRLQINSLEVICREFVKREKETLTQFLTEISEDMNELYLVMNASKGIEGIRLVPSGNDDEFDGVTLEMTFHGQSVSPPETYLSESHLNCLGICLFLASAIAFNKNNRCIVLDDVISSFDEAHRVKFGHLLRERFNDFQVLVFTHEKTWFDYMASLVESDGWTIKRVVCNKEDGVTLKNATVGQRTAI